MEMTNNKSITSYFVFMLKAPIATWWAIFTGIIGIVSFSLLSKDVVINRLWLVIIILFISFFLFITLSILTRSWLLYQNSGKTIIRQIIKEDKRHIFLLEGIKNVKIGVLLEVFRIKEFVEVPIGLIEVSHQREDGLVQAEPVWIMPAHLRELETGKLSHQSLLVYQTLSKGTLSKWVNKKAEQKIQFLMKKGMK